MVGEMTRQALMAWLVQDACRLWEIQMDRGLEDLHAMRRDTPASRRECAEWVVSQLEDDPSTRAVVFRGDGQDDVQMPALEARHDDRVEFGRADPGLAVLGDGLPYSVRRVFNDFRRFIEDGLAFQGVMLQMRSGSELVPAQNRQAYAVRMVRGGEAHEAPSYLPWAFRTKKAARTALARLAESVVPAGWDRYRIVVDNDDCRIERLPHPWQRMDGFIYEQGESAINLVVETVDLPAGFAAPRSPAGDWYVDDWNLARTKNWETRHLTGAEWLQRLDPRNGAAEDGRERSRLAEEAARNCDWWKIDFANLDPYQWVLVLRHRPDLIDRCPCIDAFDDIQWCILFRRQPQFADRFTRFNEVGPWFWSLLLRRQPQFADRCMCWDAFGPDDWRRLLKDQPGFLGKCDLEHADGALWAAVVAACPEQAAACPWTLLEGWHWAELLSERPEFAAHCDWTKIQGWQWRGLLARNPALIDQCAVGRLDLDDWFEILKAQPALATHFHAWHALTEHQQMDLLRRSPRFCDQVDWDALPKARQIDYLLLRPEFQDRMDWSTVTDARDWFRLLSCHPEFRVHAPAEAHGAKSEAYVWQSLSGPVVVVPLKFEHWISKFPDYPVDARERACNFSILYFDGNYHAGRDKHGREEVGYWEGSHIVDRIFTDCTRAGRSALALDGVWIGQSNAEGVASFASIVKSWLETHETSVKILYLECGSFYPREALLSE